MLMAAVIVLAVIPPFMAAVDKALSYLDQAVGILGVADFYTSMKYDSLDRQHGYLTRWFWRAIFDMDNIELGPERRLYLDHTLERGEYYLFSFSFIFMLSCSAFFIEVD